MKFNYGYCLEFPERYLGSHTDQKILDFGCGSGKVVNEGRKRGLNIFGADIIYGAQPKKTELPSNPNFTYIQGINNGMIDFPDDYFDIVISNQVIEHVENLEQSLKEISRILKPGGQFLCIFPSMEIWREVHGGIPFMHWFKQNARLRTPYIIAMRNLGIGKPKEKDMTQRQWAEAYLQWYDKHCFYRDKKTVSKLLAQNFSFTFIENDYVEARLKTTKFRNISGITRLPIVSVITRNIYRKFGGLVILATKKN